jgi:putative addiction module component (TIGR02574 family)
VRRESNKRYHDGMTKNADRLLQEALQLAPSDRARLAAELLSSLDDQDEDVKTAWATEIARRAADAEADPGDEEDWRAALEDIRREVLSR